MNQNSRDQRRYGGIKSIDYKRANIKRPYTAPIRFHQFRIYSSVAAASPRSTECQQIEPRLAAVRARRLSCYLCRILSKYSWECEKSTVFGMSVIRIRFSEACFSERALENAISLSDRQFEACHMMKTKTSRRQLQCNQKTWTSYIPTNIYSIFDINNNSIVAHALQLGVARSADIRLI